MSSTISSLSGYSSMMMGMGRTHRPDSAKLAEDLFSRIDTSGNGYITQSQFESAFSQLSSTSDSSTSTADQIFSKLDANGDGRVTQDEMTSGIKALSDALDSQFQSMRMSDAMGGMPPPPPPANDSGFTKDELQSQLDSLSSSGSSSDSQRASLLSDIISNFDAADSNGDGKVTFQEAMAYEQSSGGSSGTTTNSSGSSSTDSTAASSASTISDAQLMLKILQLMHAYGRSAETALAGSVSTSA